ncbi:hypothetical protein RI129_003024 [Pyrocoelia pectoralis]|uniref:BESS domain-containing protein n=1 Tax=Pyrocoelia pectoralis TaxID=417401 RepID=A0AAN7VHG6_9COLE
MFTHENDEKQEKVTQELQNKNTREMQQDDIQEMQEDDTREMSENNSEETQSAKIANLKRSSEKLSTDYQKKKRKTTTEKIFDTLSKGREDRTKLMTKIESVISEESGKPHPLKLFFASMAETVMGFPPALAVRAKMKVLQVITELELENCGEHHSSTYPSSSINSYSSRHTDTTSYSAPNSVEAPFNYTDSTGYVAPNCDEAHGNENCASLFSNFYNN